MSSGAVWYSGLDAFSSGPQSVVILLQYQQLIGSIIHAWSDLVVDICLPNTRAGLA